jgi:hypothetical protein
MLDLKITLSNEEVRAVRAYLLLLEKDTLIEQMAGHLPDSNDYATPAYVACLRLRGALTEHLNTISVPRDAKEPKGK